MELVINTRGAVQIVQVNGALDLYETPRLKDELLQLMDDDQIRIIMNLNGVNFIDSSGMGALMSVHTDLEERDGQLVIVELNEGIADLVRNNLGKLLAIYDTEAEAMALFDEA